MTQWLEPGPDISVECEWLLHEVTAVADWQFSGTPPCRTLLKTSSHHKQSTDHEAQWAYHQQRNAYMPQRAIWCPPLNTGGGVPNTVERRCSLYCAAISHISLCPWLPRSISILPPPQCSQQWSAIWEPRQQPCPHRGGEEWLWKTRTATLNRTGLAMGWAPRH